jgi:hypothetical protein
MDVAVGDHGDGISGVESREADDKSIIVRFRIIVKGTSSKMLGSD